MVRKKNKATPLAPHDAFTPTCRSARINNASPVAGTPGERFQKISAACFDLVAVAEIVTNVDCPLDDVVLPPPPTKRSKNGDSQFDTKATIIVADFPLPSAVLTQRDKTNSRLSLIQEDDAKSLLGDDDDVDDGGCGDDNRKMPARRDERTTSSSRTTAEDDDGRGDDNQKMPARRDATARQTSTAEDDGDMDAFLSSCEYDNVDEVEGEDEDHGDEVEQEDEDGDEVEQEDEDGDEVEGEDEDHGDEVEGEDEDGDQVEGGDEDGESHGDDVDPSSLFLHADEDAAALLSFFADDANYAEEEEEVVVRVNNE